MIKENETISIIIPVYNTEGLLRNCLDSVLAQTYKDIEVILVNDGSTDHSGEICDEYSKKDNRIKVLHKENEGASVARNLALEHIKGKYVGFVDSDDTIDPKYYETLLHNMKEKDVDAVLCNLWYFECSQDDVFKNILLDKIGGQITKWLFKTELWDGIRMPKGRLVQDAAVIYKVIYQAKTYMFNSKLYHYYDKNPNNVSNSKRNLYKGAIDRAVMFIDRYNWTKDIERYREDEILEGLLSKIVSFGAGAIGLYKKYNYNKEDIKLIKSFFAEHRTQISKSKMISKNRKIAVNLITFSPFLYYLLRKFTKKKDN